MGAGGVASLLDAALDSVAVSAAPGNARDHLFGCDFGIQSFAPPCSDSGRAVCADVCCGKEI